MKIHVGTSGFAYREWKGNFYPEKIAPGEMLRFYAKRFNGVEINNTFYRMPQTSILASWAAQVPSDFVFTVKAPQAITHVKQLRNVETDLALFFARLSLLGTKQGPVLFQFPRSFRADLALLKDFLALIPAGIPCAFNFRSSSWLQKETTDLLTERSFCLCVEDTDENPADTIISTASWGYVRLRRADYTDADLSLWLETMQGHQWEQVYVFFKHEEQARGPLRAVRFQELAGPPVSERRLAS